MTTDAKTQMAQPAGGDTDEEVQLERQRSVEQAIDEGHDADIPSSIGYVLDERGEEKRRKSLAEQRRNSLPRQPSHGTDDQAHADVEKGSASGGGDDKELVTSEDEANIVWWDGPDDPENPYNWPTWYKTVLCGLISAVTFVTPLASCKKSPSYPLSYFDTPRMLTPFLSKPSSRLACLS